jgi:putrescine aminotransferase
MTAPKRPLADLDRGPFLHPFTDLAAHKQNGGRILVRGEHIYITDATGHRMLDGMSGLWCANLGYSQPRIVEAVTRQLETLPFYNSFFKCTTDTTLAMAEALVDVLPEGFNHVFFTNSGSEGNDTNVRLVHRYFDLVGKPAKKQIIARRNAYHGSTIAGGSLGGMKAMHEQYTGLSYVHHVPQPYAFGDAAGRSDDEFGRDVARALEAKIDELGADRVAAFISEPVQGAGGVVIPPASYWPEVARICRERDVLIISDEVICGFGRTGSWWGCQTFGFQPDLITFAKAVTNGFQPLGGAAVGDRVAEVLTSEGGEFAHGFTYSGHPVPCAAGLATIGLYHETGIIDRVRDDTARYWQARFGALSGHRVVGEARTLGMLGALELVRDKESRVRLAPDSGGTVFCRDTAIANGLMVRQVGDTIISAPPLIVSHEEIDLLVDRLTVALDATAKHYGIN